MLSKYIKEGDKAALLSEMCCWHEIAVFSLCVCAYKVLLYYNALIVSIYFKEKKPFHGILWAWSAVAMAVHNAKVKEQHSFYTIVLFATF